MRFGSAGMMSPVLQRRKLRFAGGKVTQLSHTAEKSSEDTSPGLGTRSLTYTPSSLPEYLILGPVFLGSVWGLRSR